MKNLLSIFDFSGEWAKPWVQYGYHIYTHDIKVPSAEYLFPERIHIQGDILEWVPPEDMEFDVVLAAVPCTDLALSGARWFKRKDSSGATERSLALVHKTLSILNYYAPRVWAIENPMTRMHKLVPELGAPRLKFHPWHYGALADSPEDYYKETWLWGDFITPERAEVTPETRDANGHGKIGNAWNAPRGTWAELRSKTPQGFARAFAKANALLG